MELDKSRKINIILNLIYRDSYKKYLLKNLIILSNQI